MYLIFKSAEVIVFKCNILLTSARKKPIERKANFYHIIQPSTGKFRTHYEHKYSVQQIAQFHLQTELNADCLLDQSQSYA